MLSWENKAKETDVIKMVEDEYSWWDGIDLLM